MRTQNNPLGVGTRGLTVVRLSRQCASNVSSAIDLLNSASILTSLIHNRLQARIIFRTASSRVFLNYYLHNRRK